MIINVHEYTRADENLSSVLLAFVKSLNVQVYPCGRRRSYEIDRDGNTGTDTDKYYIPFDPEARLNTEFNNRRHIGINGFKNSFVDNWDSDKQIFSFTLSGYTFSLEMEKPLEALDSTTDLLNELGKEIVQKIAEKSTIIITEIDKIYANIKLEEIPLYSRDNTVTNTNYYTWVLRNQTNTTLALSTLDLPYSPSVNNSSNANDYYFSGLSFSVSPMTNKLVDRVTNKELTYSDNFITSGARNQYEISLCILAKDAEGLWRPYEPAKLPYIDHGETEDSVEIRHLNAESIRYNKHPIAVFDINKVQNTKFYQLHLYDALPVTQD